MLKVKYHEERTFESTLSFYIMSNKSVSNQSIWRLYYLKTLNRIHMKSLQNFGKCIFLSVVHVREKNTLKWRMASTVTLCRFVLRSFLSTTYTCPLITDRRYSPPHFWSYCRREQSYLLVKDICATYLPTEVQCDSTKGKWRVSNMGILESTWFDRRSQ
jgi:hypothetical protein